MARVKFTMEVTTDGKHGYVAAVMSAFWFIVQFMFADELPEPGVKIKQRTYTKSDYYIYLNQSGVDKIKITTRKLK